MSDVIEFQVPLPPAACRSFVWYTGHAYAIQTDECANLRCPLRDGSRKQRSRRQPEGALLCITERVSAGADASCRLDQGSDSLSSKPVWRSAALAGRLSRPLGISARGAKRRPSGFRSVIASAERFWASLTKLVSVSPVSVARSTTHGRAARSFLRDIAGFVSQTGAIRANIGWCGKHIMVRFRRGDVGMFITRTLTGSTIESRIWSY